MSERILDMLNRLILGGGLKPNPIMDNPISEAGTEAGDEVQKLNSEVMRMLDGFEINKEKIKQLILECAEMKYRGLANTEADAGILIANFIKEGSLKTLNRCD